MTFGKVGNTGLRKNYPLRYFIDMLLNFDRWGKAPGTL